MMKKFNHKFVDFVPDKVEASTLYISIEYNTAIHMCPCGCGNEVVTPLAPNDWKLTYNGESVSLYPSIGSWRLPCQSHYWIKNNEIEWAPTWNSNQIVKARHDDNVERKETDNISKPKWSFWDFFK